MENHFSLSDIDKDFFVLDPTTRSVSSVLADWAHRKYSRDAIKMHMLLNLPGGLPALIHIADGTSLK